MFKVNNKDTRATPAGMSINFQQKQQWGLFFEV